MNKTQIIAAALLAALLAGVGALTLNLSAQLAHAQTEREHARIVDICDNLHNRTNLDAWTGCIVNLKEQQR